MNDQIQRGRKLLLTYITLALLMSLAVIAFYVANRGSGRIVAQLIRFGLTATLFVALFHGHPAAKILTIVLLVVAGGLAFALVFEDSPVAILVGTGMAALYGAFARALLWSPDINAFLQYQRSTAPDP